MDLNTFFQRYRPYLAMVAAIAALIFLLPGDDGDEASALTAGGGGLDTSGQPIQGGTGALPVDNGGGTIDGGGQVSVTTPDGSPAPAPSGGFDSPGGDTVGNGGGDGPAPPGPNATNPPPPPPSGQSVANCDPNTGRIAVPTIYAPPCVAAYNGNNGGATAFGVTGDTVRVVYFQPEPDPATEAALSAAGAANSVDEQAATMQAYFDYFNAHYETYGRNVKMIIRRGSGDSTDDSVGRADALAIATEDKAFAVLGAPATNAFVDELAARGIICICTVSQPQEFYESKQGYAGYTTLMASTQGYVHRAEYVGKRLAGNGRKAIWAGTSDATVLSVLPRKFGLLWYETADGAYKAGIDFFVKELKQKYNVTLAESISYRGFPDVTATQEGARPRIQRLKQAEITSVIFSGDPIAPAIFTQEATRQQYFPEWIITGSALTDTSIFARTYDRAQWDKAFGISFLVARLPEAFGDSYYLHQWHHGTTPVADNQHGVIYPLPFAFFTGLHMAGPNLTAQSWINGIFSYPVSGSGRVTAATLSFGNHGLWPFTDYTALDDVTEIWWDGSAEGEDETGARGVGLYRYVSNGKRYLPGQHPSSDPFVFDETNTVTGYDEPPPGEGRPEYPPPG